LLNDHRVREHFCKDNIREGSSQNRRLFSTRVSTVHCERERGSASHALDDGWGESASGEGTDKGRARAT
jgi:hypothetical protein